MSNADVYVYGNLAMAPRGQECSVAVARPSRGHIVAVDGACARHAIARDRQLWAPDAFASQPPRRCSPLSLARALVLGSLLIVLAGVSVFTLLSARSSAELQAIESARYTEVSVSPGDSLWSLASEHPVTGLDTGRTVELIRERNDLSTGALHAGMTIEVPVSR